MNWYQELLCRMFCPLYLASMPVDVSGRYFAIARTTTAFGRGNWQDVRTVKGRRLAYKTARWLALKAAWKFPQEEIGIEWEIVGIEDLDSDVAR